ncbi:MAG: hydrogenase maturation nickel metallochaperone HypA [Candidatus Melainabacteria bacterium]|nr:hydrogenase maturation nickel metallochaperone HypA [Candidatus Melainabacteria bacterium]
MHEAAVALAILKRAVAAAEASAQKEEKAYAETAENTAPIFDVVKIVVQVGEFRNIDAESLEFTFSALRKEFPRTQNTELELINIKAIALCSLQNHQFHPEPANYFSCTICGGGIQNLISGKELDIVNIEIEQCLTETAA